MDKIYENTYVRKISPKMQTVMKNYVLDEYYKTLGNYGFFKKNMSLIKIDSKLLYFIEIQYYPTHGYRDFDIIISLGSFFCDVNPQMSRVIKVSASGIRMSLIYNSLKYNDDYSCKLDHFTKEKKELLLDALSHSPNIIEDPFNIRVLSSIIIFEELLMPIFLKINKLADLPIIRKEFLSLYTPDLNVPEKEDLFIYIHLKKYDEAKFVLDSLINYDNEIFNSWGISFFENEVLFEKECKRAFDEEMKKAEIKIANPSFNHKNTKYYRVYSELKDLYRIKTFFLNNDQEEIEKIALKQLLLFKEINKNLIQTT